MSIGTILLLVFLGIIAVALFRALIDKLNSDSSKVINHQDEKADFLSSNGIRSTAKELNYTDNYYSTQINPDRGHNVSFFIDQISLKIAAFSNHGLREVAPFRKIIGCEIMTDSKVTGGIGRAVVGGVLAGDVGALVGVMTAPSNIMSYKVVIYLNDPVDPMIEIPLIEEKKSTKDPDYTDAVKFAESINAAIKAIVYQNGKQ